MADSFLAYDDPATIDKRVRTHHNNQSGAAERHDEYVRQADEFVTTGFPIFIASFDGVFTDADNQNIISIFKADATIRVRLIDIRWTYNIKHATGKVWDYGTITSVHSGGTLLSKRPLDIGGAASDADVTVRSQNHTATLVNRYARVVSDGSADGNHILTYPLIWWQTIACNRSVVLRQNHGFLLRVVTAPAVPMTAQIIWQEFTP